MVWNNYTTMYDLIFTPISGLSVDEEVEMEVESAEEQIQELQQELNSEEDGY